MKNPIIRMALVLCTSVIVFAGCQSSADKVENAQEAVTDANKDLDKANAEYLADIKNYRELTALQIERNNLEIAKFKLKVEGEKKEARAQYYKDIAALEEKNNAYKKKLDTYQSDNKTNWEIFKAEFSHDMNELGTAINGLGVKSK